jgi:uncharacterized protein DUF4349/putative zinc finger protein
MSTTKHPIESEELMAYLDGELPTQQATAALAHLEQCPECETLAADLRSVSRKLMQWEVASPGPRVDAAIRAALDEQKQKPELAGNLIPRRRNIVWRRWAWAAGFATVCVMVGLFATLRNTSRVSELGRSMGDQIAVLREPASNSNVPVPEKRGQAVEMFYSAPTSQSKAGKGERYELAPAAPKSKQFDRLEQFAKLQNPPSVNFSTSGPMIIHTAGLTLTTRDFDQARVRLDEILKRHRGYLGDLNVNSPTGSGRSFTATLRVPADQLDAMLAELRQLGRVESESQGGQEVTSEYVDLEARLANSRNTEQRLTDLLRQRTGKLSDVLAVETEISRVRGDIERMEAERKNLANQVDYASINATVNEVYKAELQVMPVSTWSRLRNAAVEGYRSMVESVIGLLLFMADSGPTLLLWAAILFFPARWAWRKIRQLMNS